MRSPFPPRDSALVNQGVFSTVKQSFVLVWTVVLAACTNTPVAPSEITLAPPIATGTLSSRPSHDEDVLPFHIQHPVQFPMSRALVVFPPRNEPNVFFQNLQAFYRDVIGRSQVATYVDPEGQNVWLTEYFRFYLNGCSHDEASSRTINEIVTGNVLQTCGSESLIFPPRNLPNEFQNRLEATYRDVLRRPQMLGYVDSEGANVWSAQSSVSAPPADAVTPPRRIESSPRLGAAGSSKTASAPRHPR